MKIIVVDGLENTVFDSGAAKPTLFLKPDSALLKDNKPFFIPDVVKTLSFNLALVIRINRLGKNISTRFAHRYYNEITLGVDLFDGLLLDESMSTGSSWDLAKGFDGSAVQGQFIDLPENSLSDLHIAFQMNNGIKKRVETLSLTKSVDELIAYISQYYTMKIGDLLFINLSLKGEDLKTNQRFEGFLENNKVLDFYIR